MNGTLRLKKTQNMVFKWYGKELNGFMQMEGGELFRPVETKRASEIIVEQVLDLIRRGELKPGDRLPSERKMMDMFRRSRPTVREALRMLERNGYIRTSGGSSGAVVLTPDWTNVENYMSDVLEMGQISLEEMAEYRMVSEVRSAGWAAQRRTDEDISSMRELLAAMNAQLGNLERFTEMDSQFHGLVARAARNKVCEIFNRTFSKVNRSFVLKHQSADTDLIIEKNRAVQQMHENIFEAIKDGDKEKAEEMMRVHLEAFSENLK